MVYIFIGIFIIVLALLLTWRFTEEPDEWLPNIFGSLFVSFFVVAVLCGVVLAIGRATLETEERVGKSYELVALDTEKETVGSYSSIFFVGSGYIGEEMYYHFFYNTSKGIRYNKIKAESCYIIETQDTPKYVEYHKYYKDKESIFYDSYSQGVTRTVLFIPKGTIKNNYKVN